jgi:hypothetical protein
MEVPVGYSVIGGLGEYEYQEGSNREYSIHLQNGNKLTLLNKVIVVAGRTGIAG